jgi:uncharacterized membrane protein
MAIDGCLWAIGYDNMKRADQVREEIIELGWGAKHYLMLDDVAVVVRHPDGSFMLDRKAFPTRTNVVGCSVVGFVAGLVLGAPLTGATIGAMVGGAGSVAVLTSVGIGDDFVSEVKERMKPGTSALLVLDHGGDKEVILAAIRGLGGTVLRTNVDLERAQLIQSTLAAPSAQTRKSDDK